MIKSKNRILIVMIVLVLAGLSCSLGAEAEYLNTSNRIEMVFCLASGGVWTYDLEGGTNEGWCDHGEADAPSAVEEIEDSKPDVAEEVTDTSEPDSIESFDETGDDAEDNQDDLQNGETTVEETLENPSNIDTYRGTSNLCDVIIAENEVWYFGQITGNEITITVDENGAVNGLLICITNTGVRQVLDDVCTYDATNTLTGTLSGNLSDNNDTVQIEISWVEYVLRWNCPTGDGVMFDQTATANAKVTIVGNKMSGSISDWYYPFSFEAHLQE